MSAPIEILERTLRPRRPVDLRLTLGLVARPATMLVGPGEVWRATRTPQGSATLSLRSAHGGTIHARAWGAGAGWALEHAPELIGDTDDIDDFRPPPGSLVAELASRFRGMRIPRTRAVFEMLVPAVLEQKVIGKEARRAYAGLVRRFGEPAPGPAGVIPQRLRLLPSPETVAGLPSYAFHPLGVERKRSDTLRLVARNAARLEECSGMPTANAHDRLCSLPGIGRWTSAEVAIVALGDSDAVSVGDYHLPNLVSWAFAGEPRGTDDRMLELLEPYRGHRGRVVRLLERGIGHAPRYGPRLALREIHR